MTTKANNAILTWAMQRYKSVRKDVVFGIIRSDGELISKINIYINYKYIGTDNDNDYL